MSGKKSVVVEHLKRAQMLEVISKGKRLDGRGLLDTRPTSVEVGVIEKASGSAMVRLGNTEVIAGVKIQTGTPFEDTPDKGLLIVTAEVLPLASAYAEPGPPNEEAIELARVVDRGIRESGIIDLSELCLVEGKTVQAVFVDISVLNVDGNLFDAASYAAVAALASSKKPKYEVDKEGEVKDTGKKVALPIKLIPVSITMAVIDDTLIVDPTLEEESVMTARVTLTSADKDVLCAGQKGCPGGFSTEQIKLAVDTALKKGEEVRQIIKKSVERGKKKK
ncbi:MAG: exosome complex protein Rrp42 [Nitrososphaerales archaeon]